MEIRLAEERDRKVLTEMVNEVYYTSEREFWEEGYYRISEENYSEYIKEKWLYLAIENNEIVGCVLLKRSTPTASCFSMLVCHPMHRKKGIGRLLVDFVHQQAKEQGDEFMRLEILSPRDWVHQEKVFLKAWYASLGYRLVKEANFLDFHPDHAQFMKCDLIFRLYEKPLT